MPASSRPRNSSHRAVFGHIMTTIGRSTLPMLASHQLVERRECRGPRPSCNGTDVRPGQRRDGRTGVLGAGVTGRQAHGCDPRALQVPRSIEASLTAPGAVGPRAAGSAVADHRVRKSLVKSMEPATSAWYNYAFGAATCVQVQDDHGTGDHTTNGAVRWRSTRIRP